MARFSRTIYAGVLRVFNLSAKPAPKHNQQAEGQDADQYVVPVPHEYRWFERGRQPGVEHTLDAQRQGVDNAPDRIDNRRYSRIGGADQWQPFGDGKNARLLKVLIGSGAYSK